MIDEIEMVRRAKVRRAKLYFVREKAAKEIRRQMRRTLAHRDPGQNTDTKIAAPVVEEAPAETETK